MKMIELMKILRMMKTKKIMWLRKRRTRTLKMIESNIVFVRHDT